MKQKNNIRRLNAIGKIFDLEKFYSIMLNTEVQLQGKYDRNIVVKATDNKFKASISVLGYVDLTRGNYKITLT